MNQHAKYLGQRSFSSKVQKLLFGHAPHTQDSLQYLGH